jgi:translocation and assembly module TamB
VKRALWSVLILLALLGGGVAVLLGSEVGLRTLLTLGQRMAPGELTVSRVEGQILGGFELQQLRYESPGFGLALRELELRWQPRALLQGTLHVELLRAVGVSLRREPSDAPVVEDEPATGPPELELPVVVQLDELQVQELSLSEGAQPPRTVLESLRLESLRLDRTLSLGALRANGPEWQVQAAGRALPREDWTMNLELDWRAEIPDRGSQAGIGTLTGDATSVELYQRLTGFAPGVLRARLQEPFGELSWDLRLGLEGLVLSELPQAPLAGRLQASGDRKSAHIEGRIGLAIAETGPLLADFQVDANAEVLRIDQLELNATRAGSHLLLTGDVGLQPLTLNLAGNWRELRWPLLGEPQLRSEHGALTVDGALEDLLAELQAQLSSPLLEAPGVPAQPLSLQLRATRKGTSLALQELQLRAPDSPLRLSAEGRFDMENGDYAGSGAWSALRWPLTGDSVVESPDGGVEAHGTGREFQAELETYLRAAATAAEGALPTLRVVAHANGGETLRLDRLSIADLASELGLELQGSLDPESLAFEASGHWQSLRWPLVGNAMVVSGKGRLSASGTPDDYTADLGLDLSGPQIPPAQWHARASGGRKNLQLEELAADILGGSFAASGTVDWTAMPTWSAQIHGKGLEPDRQWPAVKGRVGLEVEANGVVADVPETSLRLVSLSGSLLQNPLSGYGAMQLQGAEFEIPELSLALGDNRLQASGSLDQNWSLNWSLKAPELEQLLTTLAGGFAAQGSVKGPRERPSLQLDLEGDEIAVSDTRVGRLRGRAEVDLSGAKSSAARLRLSDVTAAGMRWQSMRLEADGSPAQHRLALTTDGDLELRSALSGALGQNTGSWSGTLQQLELQHELAGRWRLSSPASLTAAGGALRASEACLLSAPARLCLQGERGADGKARGDISLVALPLERLAALLPSGLQLDGSLDLNGNGGVSTAGVPTADARLQLQNVSLSLDAGGQEPLRLTLVDSRADATLQEDQARASVFLGIQDRGELAAKFVARDPLGSPSLSGSVKGYLDSLDFLPLLVPAIAESDGRLDLDLALAGSATRPQLGGELTLSAFKADLPAVGIAISEGEASLEGRADGKLNLAASASSGPGSLRLSGQLDPSARGLDLQIAGNNFQAVETRTLSIRVSPRLAVRASPQAANVSGEVLIPYARILPPERAGAVSVSDDVVIVGPDSEEPTQAAGGTRLTADVTVRIGEDVRVEAYGLNANLDGTLRVRQDPGRALQGSGAVEVAAGTYEVFGQQLDIERGRVMFAGPLTSPGLDVRAVRRVDEVVSGVMVSGPIRQPEIEIFSEPAMPQSAALSYLIFGRPPAGGDGAGEGQMLSRALSALAASGGNRLGEKFAGGLGVDEITFDSGADAKDTSVAVGKYLTPKLYFRYGVGLLEPVSTFLARYRLSDRFTVETFTGTESSGADLNFELER